MLVRIINFTEDTGRREIAIVADASVKPVGVEFPHRSAMSLAETLFVMVLDPGTKIPNSRENAPNDA